MRTFMLVSLVGLIMVLGLSSAPETNPYQEMYDDLLKPSVKITAGGATGSGVVINDQLTMTNNQLYILTAAHVVGDYSSVTATFYTYHQDSKTPSIPLSLSAFVVMTDTAKDLALLATESHGRTRIYSARLAPRNYQPYLFTEVWAVGCSLGYPPRPSSGHITSIDSSSFVSIRGYEISAPIVPGNSGGGVFLKDTHELIGIAVWVRTYHGQLITTMAGVVPLHEIYDFLDSINHKDSKTPRKP